MGVVVYLLPNGTREAVRLAMFPEYERAPDDDARRNLIEGWIKSQSDDAIPTEPTGWRFLAEDAASNRKVACHVGQPRPDHPEKLTGLSTAPSIQNALDRLGELENLPDVQSDDFELRVLRIPRLQIEAFWLHAKSGDKDRFVPYAGFVERPDKQLNLMKSYDRSGFLRAILDRTLKLPDEYPE